MSSLTLETSEKPIAAAPKIINVFVSDQSASHPTIGLITAKPSVVIIAIVDNTVARLSEGIYLL